MSVEQLYTPESFMHGNPAELMQAEEYPKILTVWPHGDETLGPRLGHHLYSEEPGLLTHVDYLCGNPEAAAQDPPARYTENISLPGYTAPGTDLNRSFTPGVTPQSYEQHRAQEIRGIIDTNNYDYVLDLHTTTTGGGRYFIVNEQFLDNQKVQDIIAASPINRVVVFPEWIARDGLIGNVPNSISVEYHRPIADQVGVEESLLTIRGLIAGKSLIPADERERELFYVSGLIPKDDDPGEDARNFELCEQDYYPVLFGENSYRRDPTKPYLGFAATRREVITL